MIYLDTSVALAQLLSEDRQPPPHLWARDLVSSRLLEYEIITRINARGLARTHTEAARRLLGFVSTLEMAPPILERALEPFPLLVRTLDAIHLSSMVFLTSGKQQVQLASFDDRLNRAAAALDIGLWPDLQNNPTDGS